MPLKIVTARVIPGVANWVTKAVVFAGSDTS
jgi:hypothetical protein